MQRSNISAPIADHNDTIFSSIELSRKEWLVTVQSPDRDKLSRRWPPGIMSACWSC
jgi:transposase